MRSFHRFVLVRNGRFWSRACAGGWCLSAAFEKKKFFLVCEKRRNMVVSLYLELGEFCGRSYGGGQVSVDGKKCGSV